MRDSVMLPASLQGYHEVIFYNLAGSDWVLSSWDMPHWSRRRQAWSLRKSCYCNIPPAQNGRFRTKQFWSTNTLPVIYVLYTYIIVYIYMWYAWMYDVWYMWYMWCDICDICHTVYVIYNVYIYNVYIYIYYINVYMVPPPKKYCYYFYWYLRYICNNG